MIPDSVWIVGIGLLWLCGAVWLQERARKRANRQERTLRGFEEGGR